jgi:hypothetical protein
MFSPTSLSALGVVLDHSIADVIESSNKIETGDVFMKMKPIDIVFFSSIMRMCTRRDTYDCNEFDISVETIGLMETYYGLPLHLDTTKINMDLILLAFRKKGFLAAYHTVDNNMIPFVSWSHDTFETFVSCSSDEYSDNIHNHVHGQELNHVEVANEDQPVVMQNEMPVGMNIINEDEDDDSDDDEDADWYIRNIDEDLVNDFYGNTFIPEDHTTYDWELLSNAERERANEWYDVILNGYTTRNLEYNAHEYVNLVARNAGSLDTIINTDEFRNAKELFVQWIAEKDQERDDLAAQHSTMIARLLAKRRYENRILIS